MSKILIIGQAPALKKQFFPYDTTLLYTILEWVGVSTGKAQEIFEFEALVNEFPGKNKYGAHLAPSREQVEKYWNSTLKGKLIASEKVITLGKVAEKYYTLFTINWAVRPAVISLPHPSRRNYSLIMKNKEQITTQLKTFLFS